MQRKPGFPVANCNIKVPDGSQILDESSYITCDDEIDQQRKRQQLINFGHSQWGFNNWSWSVSKQDLDFVDFASGKYTAGVVAFVSITVKNLDINRENIGYATSVASMKGSAIYKSRKGAVTNALRETLLSFGGSVATELTELLLTSKPEVHPTTSNPEPIPQENNQNIINKPLGEPKNLPKLPRKEEVPIPTPPQIITNPVVKIPPRKTPVPVMTPTNKPFPANQPPRAPQPQPPPPRPNSNVTDPKPLPSLEGMTEDEARAERKRRQRQAQEEFRLKQIMKTSEADKTDRQELHKSSFDNLLMDIPTQDIVIEETAPERKRSSPEPGSAAKRRGGISKLDIVTD